MSGKRGNLIFLGTVIMLAFIVLLGMPLGVGVWLLTVFAVYAAPDPEMLEDDTTFRADLYRKLRRARKAVFGWCSDVWRLGPANPPQNPPPDQNEPQGLRPVAGMFRPLTYVSVLAAALMVGVVGLEMLLGDFAAAHVSPTPPTRTPTAETAGAGAMPSAAPEGSNLSVDKAVQWVITNNADNRNWRTGLLGSIPVWVTVNALAASFRFKKIKTHECVAPPTIVENPVTQFLRIIAPAVAALGIASGVLMIVFAPPGGNSWTPTLLTLWGLGSAGLGARLLQPNIIQQKADWLYRNQQVMDWRTKWWSVPALRTRDVSEIPAYYSESDFPLPPNPDSDQEKIEQRGSPDGNGKSLPPAKRFFNAVLSVLKAFLPLSDEPADSLAVTPTHRTTAVTLQPGYRFADYQDMGTQLAPAIGQTRVLLEQHQQTPGSPSWGVMLITFELDDLGKNPHLNRDLPAATCEFATRWAVIEGFAALKLDRPLHIRSGWVTHQTSSAHIRESVWMLPPGVTNDQVSAKATAISEKLDVSWLRTWQPPGSNYLYIYFGDPPKNARFGDRMAEQNVHEADWMHHMRASGLVGHASQLPRMVSVGQTSFGAKQLHFRLPPGLSYSAVTEESTINKLIAASGWVYVDPHEDADDPTSFSLVIGDEDPLNNVYAFTDYKSDLLHSPVKGAPNISWFVGIGSDGQPIKYGWDFEEPHLLVAGSSGSGKSGVINSCLVQMLHNNDPDDLHLWMCEPKNELQTYQHLAHVRRFLDAQVTDCSPYEAAALLLEEAKAEMYRRYATFSLHPAAPQKLAEARHIASVDPVNSAHLMLPYIVIVIEECSSYFSTPGVKAERAHHDRLLSAVMELARTSRAAGIHMLVATQYPTNVNIPQTLKQQCRRLGLQTADQLASEVIIDQKGLERIKVKGRGMVTGESGGYEHFRGFWMNRPDSSNPDIPDDRMDILSKLETTVVWPKLPSTVPPSPLSIERVITLPNGTRVKSRAPDPDSPDYEVSAKSGRHRHRVTSESTANLFDAAPPPLPPTPPNLPEPPQPPSWKQKRTPPPLPPKPSTVPAQ